MKTLDDVDLALKRAFVRVDFNVPLDINRRVKDDLGSRPFCRRYGRSSTRKVKSF